ncbi:efflux transporter periplasmic adaptor subunit [Scytonema hofmannii PCC 7110]|uniref:Efflux transporter periplasmic adaptor subunit n=1 Tax=Scytonema hofmannii PCC 7110 TaxID=128403 RepID=A0A139X2A3_9CYAN|nr:efflux RND transporter periplasmic adaptor subunit [Scytonema hofmannii]KYC38839.1 efflux transporter periplasmic adaptor subunit [Scytonema hofmannii PCC 7110]
MKFPEPQTHFEDNLPERTSEEPPRRQRRWLWLLIALAVLAGGGYALWRFLAPGQQQPSPASAQPPGVRVKISTVQTGIIEDSSEFVANLESRRSVNLQPRVQGQVAQIYVRSGDTVAVGDPIIQVDAREQQASVSGVAAAAEVARSQMENVRATLQSLQAERLSNLSDVKLNQREYDRYARLAAEGAESRQVRDQYANRLETAQAQLRATEARIKAQEASIIQAEKSLKQAQANINQQQVQLQYYKITAPFPGTVGDIPVKVGDFVNTSTQLATITQNQPLELNIFVPSERGSQLRKGTPVEVMDAQGKNLGMSRVFFISPSVNNNTQALLIKALYDNNRNQLRADQFARARVIWNQRPGVLVPTTAVTRVAGETFVYVAQTPPPSPSPQSAQEGEFQLVARQKRVKLGNIKGNNYQVLEGLQPGDRIIVSGLLNLRDGAPIIPES